MSRNERDIDRSVLLITELFLKNKEKIISHPKGPLFGMQKELDISYFTSEKYFSIMCPERKIEKMFEIFEFLSKNKMEIIELLKLQMELWVIMWGSSYDQKDKKEMEKQLLDSNEILRDCEKKHYNTYEYFLIKKGESEDTAQKISELLRKSSFPYMTKSKTLEELDKTPFEAFIPNSIFAFLDNRGGECISHLIKYNKKDSFYEFIMNIGSSPGYTCIHILKPIRILKRKKIIGKATRPFTLFGYTYDKNKREIKLSLNDLKKGKQFFGLIEPYTFSCSEEYYFFMSNTLEKIEVYIENTTKKLNRPGVICETLLSDAYH